jgi:transposase
VRRYDCANPACGKRFSERFASFTGKQRSTHRLRAHMVQTGKHLAHTEAEDVLRKEGVQVSRHLVRDLVLAEAEQVEAPPTEAVETLGLDDFARKKRNDYATVVTDLTTPRVVDGVEGRDQKTIKAYLQKLPWVGAILGVVMDLWSAYYEAVREAIPRARIVIDKWRVLKHVNEALDKVRKRLQKAAGPGGQRAL